MTKPADTTLIVAKIDAVQAEYSAFETLHETDGLIATARELNIAYVAYSPLGHGWLVDDFPYESPDDFAPDDFRRTGKLLFTHRTYKTKQAADLHPAKPQSPNSKARTSTTTRKSSSRSRL